MFRSPRRHLLIGVAATLAAASLSGCTGDEKTARADTRPTTSTTTPSAEMDAPDMRWTNLGLALNERSEQLGLVSGVGLTVVHKDRGVIHQYHGGMISPTRISLVDSAASWLTAGVLLRLEDEGELDLDKPVADYVDWGDAHPEVTVAQLLSNSSGLTGRDTAEPFAPYFCQYVATADLQECAEQIFASVDDDEVTAAPDTEFREGGAQWQIAGAVAEAVSGRSWAELVTDTYVKPCELTTLGYNNHFSQLQSDAGLAAYPTAFGGDPTTLKATGNPNLGGGAYTTVQDMAVLLQMLLNGGKCGDEQVLSKAAVERMVADRIGEAYDGSTGEDFEGYGLGWFVDRDQPGLIEAPGAFGAVAWVDLERGYGAYVSMEAEARFGKVVARQLQPLIAAIIDEDAEKAAAEADDTSGD